MMILCASTTYDFYLLVSKCTFAFVSIQMDMNAVLNTVIALLYFCVSHLLNIWFCKHLSISLSAYRVVCFSDIAIAVGYQNVVLCHVVYTLLNTEWHKFTNSCNVCSWLCMQWPYYFKLFSVGNFFSWLISNSFFFPVLIWISKD
jgi:hypothetical protein